MSSSDSETPPLVIVSLTHASRPVRAEAIVRVSSPVYMRTRAVPDIAKRVLARYPEMVRHKCACGSARGIASELADTETPHLMEHIALELLALDGAPRSETRGETSWDFARDGRGVFRVRVECADASACDAAAIERALHEARAITNGLLTG